MNKTTPYNIGFDDFSFYGKQQDLAQINCTSTTLDSTREYDEVSSVSVFKTVGIFVNLSPIFN
jgi:hypothetical protein